ncbi:MAG: hypothetical protein ACI8WM_000867 [Burkholderiaceae bacterium]
MGTDFCAHARISIKSVNSDGSAVHLRGHDEAVPTLRGAIHFTAHAFVCVLSALHAELQRRQTRIQAIERDQFSMRAHLHDMSMLEHNDAIRPFDGCQSMRND